MSLTDALLLDPYRFNVYLAVRADGQKGSGTISDPYHCGDATTFDGLMNSFAEGTTVHLGPASISSPFKTAGYGDGVAGGWTPKKAMRVIGSGIDVTYLRLEPSAAGTFFAVGHPLGANANVDFFEICDLTINCNLTALNADAAAGAVRVMGNHASIRRLKAINWGTKSASRPCTIFSVITADPQGTNKEVANTGIESCIAITPQGTSTAGNTTIFHAGPNPATSVAENYGPAPYIRNCFADCGSPTHTCEFRGFVMAACRGGIVEGNQFHNLHIGGPVQTSGYTMDVIVRNNFFKNVRKGLYMSLGTLSPGTPTALTSLARDSGDNSIAVATLTSHGLKQGERVKMDASAGSPAQFKGVFTIKDVTTNSFRYQMVSAPGADATSGTFQKVSGVANLLFDANTIELATGSTGQIAMHLDCAAITPETPDYAYGDIILRRNRIRYMDVQFEASYAGYALDAEGIKQLFVHDNMIECAPADPLKYTRCGVARFFNNRAPNGTLVRGITGAQKATELEIEAEDALLVSLI
jgi:hypothetical protein